MSSVKIQLRCFLAVPLLCALSCVNAIGSPTSVNNAVMDLGSPDKAVRRQAYDTLAKEGNAGLIPVLKAFQAGLLENRDGRPVIYQPRARADSQKREYSLLDGITGKPLLDVKGSPVVAERLSSSMIRADRKERTTIAALIKVLSLTHSDPEKRIAAITAAGDAADVSLLPTLQQQLQRNPEKTIADALVEAIASIQVIHGSKAEKIKAAQTLGDSGAARGTPLLQKALKDQTNDAEIKSALSGALSKIAGYQRKIRFVHNLFSGLSLGSILVLMALGLAVIFGLMDVINMAHGEFMMLGAFTAYVVCECFKRFLPVEFFDYYFFCAIPAAFLISACAGWVCEWALVRHLYGRPLETLLATWGVSLVLIQTVRVMFGDTLSLTPPEWLNGSWAVAQDLAFPVNRLFIIVFCAACTVMFYLIVQKTKLGLLLRSTVQDRETAATLGVPIRRVDGFTFALGTGMAGLAGCVIPLYDKINPGMGQGYVVESFMVVVLGGVGKLAGGIIGGISLGFLTKFIEPFLQAVYGKVAVLAMIIIFLQWRPSGLFPAKGRFADE
ncbi:MAG: urea ABC transporter permease subunit UrtB [Pseudomonadota bacterium]